MTKLNSTGFANLAAGMAHHATLGKTAVVNFRLDQPGLMKITRIDRQRLGQAMPYTGLTEIAARAGKIHFWITALTAFNYPEMTDFDTGVAAFTGMDKILLIPGPGWPDWVFFLLAIKLV